MQREMAGFDWSLKIFSKHHAAGDLKGNHSVGSMLQQSSRLTVANAISPTISH
jgi:hypothetical protein